MFYRRALHQQHAWSNTQHVQEGSDAPKRCMWPMMEACWRSCFSVCGTGAPHKRVSASAQLAHSGGDSSATGPSDNSPAYTATVRLWRTAC